MVGEGKSAGAGDHGVKFNISKLFEGFLQQIKERFSDVGKMPFIVRKQNMISIVQNGNFDSGRTDVNTQGIMLIFHSIPPFCQGIISYLLCNRKK